MASHLWRCWGDAWIQAKSNMACFVVFCYSNYDGSKYMTWWLHPSKVKDIFAYVNNSYHTELSGTPTWNPPPLKVRTCEEQIISIVAEDYLTLCHPRVSADMSLSHSDSSTEVLGLGVSRFRGILLAILNYEILQNNVAWNHWYLKKFWR